MITLYFESRFGLARGAVYAGGQPHLYAEGLENDPSLARVGVRSVARLKGRGGGVAFLALADGAEAVLDAPQEVMAKLTEGAVIEVEIIAEARQDKLARAKYIAAGEGEPRRLSLLLSLRDRLLGQARNLFPDVDIQIGDDTDLIDEAETTALNPSGPLPEGGYLSIERTRALIACDVDAAGGGAGLAHTPKSFAKLCNERAAGELGRRLRLSGLAGLVVVDLIGNRHDAARLHAALRSGFATEAQTLVIGPVGKFGTLEFVRPWGACPLMDTINDPLRAAHGLLRQAAKRAADEPGQLLTLRAPQSLLDKVRPLLSGSMDPLAAIIRLQAALKIRDRNSMTIRYCTRCKQPYGEAIEGVVNAAPSFAPFCSKRCADIDLVHWLKGDYVIDGFGRTSGWRGGRGARRHASIRRWGKTRNFSKNPAFSAGQGDLAPPIDLPPVRSALNTDT